MKNTTWMIGAALLLSGAVNGTMAGVEFDADGAVPGKWTMDYEAAKKVAQEKQLPILLDFSGSDWCGWCKVMEENVFTKPEWATYAKDNLMMVLIDFPKDKSLVPEKYVERNNALKDEYGIRGYPTFVVLDQDGKTELGRLKSGRDKTPESFQAELKNLLRFRQAEVEKYCAALSGEDRKTYRGFLDELATKQAEQKLAEKEEAEARAKARQLKRDVGELEEKMLEFRVAQLDEEERKKFEELETKLEETGKKLSDWMRSKPERNDENMKLYEAMQAEIQEIEQQISQY
ncbi:Disulfide bond reductase DsbH [Pontiella desulfatans]|uniref:Disulfide bond reductase DsbH n=1 Tax=Pontiella desulfatans TaxID=2750659 RepID=A0A6C2U6Z2_PONDE|nr:thioredoxin family protein [Pontiella desulfatans]VGO15842.1 Disulfide bond reductase DsbH [Pontiella desulfatans]